MFRYTIPDFVWFFSFLAVVLDCYMFRCVRLCWLLVVYFGLVVLDRLYVFEVFDVCFGVFDFRLICSFWLFRVFLLFVVYVSVLACRCFIRVWFSMFYMCCCFVRLFFYMCFDVLLSCIVLVCFVFLFLVCFYMFWSFDCFVRVDCSIY